MALAQVKKIEIYALQQEREQLLELLQNLASIEIAEFNDSESVSAYFENAVTQTGDQINSIDRKIAEVYRALNFLELIIPTKPSFIEQFAGVKTYLSPEQFMNLRQAEGRLQTVLEKLSTLEQTLVHNQTKRSQLESLFEIFKPWEHLKLTKEQLAGTTNIQVILGAVDGTGEALANALATGETPNHLELVADTSQGTMFLLFVARDNYQEVQPILVQHNVNTVTLPAFDSTVAVKLSEIQRELQELTVEEVKLKDQVAELNAERALLQVWYDSLISQRQRAEIVDRLAHEQRSFALTGWIAADKVEHLQQELAKVNFNHLLVVKDPEPDDEVPIILKNNPAITPFEYLIQSFSFPRSKEVDPTPAIAPFFFIFFGIALGDAGYGLILSIVCAVLLLKLKMGPIGKKLSWMFLISGLGSIIFGLITGSVLSLPIKFGVFNPLENPIMLLIIALALGLIQLYFGTIISAWGDIKAGRWMDVIWNQGFWLFFLTSVILVLGKDALGLSQYSATFTNLLLIAAIGLVLGNTRGKKGILKKILALPGGLFSIYNSIGFFSDVLSYSRLMALGLSGGVMGGIMNQLAWMVVESVPVVGWIFGAAIFLFGHALNFSLSVLGAYVHSSRLQYLEFFGKFYEGGGKPLTPFKKEHKYTFLVNEREA